MSVIELNTNNFNETISQGITVVDFWAPWCGPCRMLTPTIEELGNEADGFQVGKLNVDDNPEIAEKYDVLSIPTIIIFKNGEIADTSVGLATKAVLQKKVDTLK